MTEQLRAYYQEYKSVFEDNFRIVLENFDVEAIHKMRTSTKRLRALFILMEFLSRKKFNAKKQLRKIRTLFKFTGKIREIQIEQMLVTSYQEILKEDYRVYMEYLKRREHREISRFLKHLPAQKERGMILDNEKILLAFDKMEKESTKKRAAKFVQSKEKKIGKIISAHPSNHTIHTNRTHLKQLYYLFEILTGLTGSNTIMGMNYFRIREIEQYLGEWHDLVNSPVYMNAFFKTKSYKGEKKYSTLKKQISQKRKEMRKEIINKIYPGINS